MATGRDVLGVVGQERVAEFEQHQHALVGDEIEDGAMLTPRVDEAAPAQTGEVVGDAGLAIRSFAAIAPTGSSPSARRSSRMRRRLGSARTRKYVATRSLLAGEAGNWKGASCRTVLTFSSISDG